MFIEWRYLIVIQIQVNNSTLNYVVIYEKYTQVELSLDKQDINNILNIHINSTYYIFLEH